MKLITRQILADEAPARFAAVYSNYQYTRHDKTIAQLLALSKPIDADEVDRIIGNRTWTEVPKCHECGTEGHVAVVQVGEEPDYESHTACLCMTCAQKAVEALRGQP
jgi:hypothetical protein